MVAPLATQFVARDATLAPPGASGGVAEVTRLTISGGDFLRILCENKRATALQDCGDR